MRLKVDFSKTVHTRGPLVAIEIKNITGKLFMLDECVIGESHIIGYLIKGNSEDVAILEQNNFQCSEVK